MAPVQIDREWPVLARTEEGSVLSGIADMLVQTESGIWIIDHKSDQCDDYEQRFKEYLPQLEAYASALSQVSALKPIAGVGINWIRRGSVYSLSI